LEEKMSSVLVTGGSGYIGSCLALLLRKEGYNVTVFDVREPAVDVGYINGDITDKALVQTVAAEFDSVVHLAAIAGYPACDKDPDKAWKTNVGGTENIRSAGKPLVFASALSSYGEQAMLEIDETVPLNPKSVYARTKSDAEGLVQRESAVILRFASVFGVSPRMRWDLLVNDFVHRAVKTGKIELYEEHVRRDFLHVGDAAKSILFALKHFAGMAGDVFNVTGVNVTKRELASIIASFLKVEILPTAGADQEKRNFIFSSKKIRSLGFTPSHTLEHGVKELIDAARSEPDIRGG
jgi:nucleoside-diphosphate-sugar epimerase